MFCHLSLLIPLLHFFPITTLTNRFLNDTIYHDPGIFDPDGDSLSFELVECLGENCNPIGGYSFPSDFGGFQQLDSIGVLSYSVPALIDLKMSFAIIVKKWRNGFNICSSYRDILVEDYWLTINDSELTTQLKLFPNPSSDNFHLQFDSKENFDDEVEVFNLIGEKVFSQSASIHVGENEMQFDCSNLADGIYFLRIGKRNLQKKFLIQN